MRPQVVATNLCGRGAHDHYGRVVSQETRSDQRITSIWMPSDRVDSDITGSDDAIVRGIDIDERECGHSCVYRETQYPVQRGPRDEFRREDDS